MSSRGLAVVGVHTPEFDLERDPDGVRRHATHLGVTWPVVIDNDQKMWDALDNVYWPTVYLIDRKGFLRYAHSGETHAGDDEARHVERVIESLLREKG